MHDSKIHCLISKHGRVIPSTNQSQTLIWSLSCIYSPISLPPATKHGRAPAFCLPASSFHPLTHLSHSHRGDFYNGTTIHGTLQWLLSACRIESKLLNSPSRAPLTLSLPVSLGWHLCTVLSSSNTLSSHSELLTDPPRTHVFMPLHILFSPLNIFLFPSCFPSSLGKSFRTF